MTTLVGVLGAFAAAVSYGVASVLQAVAARRATGVDGLDPRLLARLARQVPYLVGLALDLVGFLASVLALRTLPLFFVQSAVAASVGVTAVVAVLALGARLTGRETAALAGLGTGLVLLAVTARPERAVPLPAAGRWALLAAVLVLVGYGALTARMRDPAGAAALAIGAGLGFGGVGVAARTLEVPDPLWRLVLDPSAWALCGYGAVAILLFATALQRGTVTVVSALTFAVETVMPSALGVALLGDRPRPGMAPLAAAGFVVTLAGAVLLARYGEPDAPAADHPPGSGRQ